jgi:hypothetical protein
MKAAGTIFGTVIVIEKGKTRQTASNKLKIRGEGKK